MFERLIASGGNAAYVDIDQLGLLGPFDRLTGSAPHTMKANNLARVVDVLRTHGLRQMIVSGVVDPEHGAARFDELAAPTIAPTHVRLRCDWAELERRYLGRGSDPDTIAALREIADLYDRSAIGTVDTTGLDVDDVAHNLAANHCAVRPAPWSPAPAVDAAPLPTTVLYGATAVGTSTVGWELVRHRWARGRATAYIDAGQLGFHGAAYDPAVHASAYAALTRGYERAGAQDLIVVTHDPELVLTAHRHHAPTRVLLDASDAALTSRVGLRSRTSTGLLPGDEIVRADPTRQRLLAERAHRQAARLRNDDGADITIDTTDDEPSGTVERVERALAERA
ncbi:hypothetical protein AXK61_06350 [Tsukamurella pseudospumae]|uniref:Adenylyl-sulfate kinase n=1 Tax=Tsukamurella pseudospumae TaxID=239498 RepID=A0A137YZ09_9ACTN|nr:hypothetical protein AXK61_06350 [Tsukamurella pseudospumae]